MGNRFVVIKADEFKDWIFRRGKHREFDNDEYKLDLDNWQTERRVTSKEINEFCLRISLGHNICLKIYTSIDKITRESRDRGKDSIKIVVANESTLEPIRGRITHTYRRDNWKENLDKNLVEALEKLYGVENIKCPNKKCRGKLIIKRNRDKDQTFLGCTRWEKGHGEGISLEQMWTRSFR